MSLFQSGHQTAMVPIVTLGGADATLRPFGAPRKRTAVHSEDDGASRRSTKITVEDGDGRLAVLTHV